MDTEKIKDNVNIRYETRITLLERIAEEHEKDIKELKILGNQMSLELQEIVKLINKIKNWIIGGIVVFAFQQVGLVEAVKLFFKIGG